MADPSKATAPGITGPDSPSIDCTNVLDVDIRAFRTVDCASFVDVFRDPMDGLPVSEPNHVGMSALWMKSSTTFTRRLWTEVS